MDWAQRERRENPADSDERRQWAQRTHAAKRAKERYGVVLDARALRELAAGMADTSTKPGMLYMGRTFDERRTSMWLVMVDRVDMLAVFDEDTRAIATFLPWDASQVAFRDGRFVGLVGGGSRQARELWKAFGRG